MDKIEPVAFRGNDSQYVSLTIEATTSGYTLKTEFVDYQPGIRNIREPISIKEVSDEGEAIEVATDLEYEAIKYLNVMDIEATSNVDFGRAVIKWFDRSARKAA